MAKKKPIKAQVEKTPFGYGVRAVGGSKESRRIAEDMIFSTTLLHGFFSSSETWTPQEIADNVNNRLKEKGYPVEV